MKTLLIPRRILFTILITGLFCFSTQAQGLPEDEPVSVDETLIYGDDLPDMDIIDEDAPDIAGAPAAAETELVIAPALEALWIRGGATDSTQDDWRARLGMQVHRWDNIPGNPVGNLTGSREFYGPPSASLQVEAAELSKADAENFPVEGNGVRARALLVIPEDGEYSFALSADDAADFYLGEPGGSRFTKKKTLSCTSYQYERDWSKLRTTARSYKAGDILWVEVLNKNGLGSQHFSIAWKRPGEMDYSLIPSALDDGRVILTIPPAEPEDPDDIGVPASWLAAMGLGGAHPYDDPRVRLYEDTDGDGFNLLQEYQTGGRPDEIGGNRGYVNVEKWTNAKGGNITNFFGTEQILQPPSAYTRQDGLDLFESGTNYALRVRTLVTPPMGGRWYFYIASDDCGQLYLSPTTSRFEKKKIAWNNQYVSRYQWTKYATQKSAAQELAAGVPLFLEGLMYQAGGSYHMGIAWQHEPENLCRMPGVTASQSTTFRSDEGAWGAQRAIDGSTGTMNHTDNGSDPSWLEIDFNTLVDINRVVLHNRPSYHSRLSNFRLSILDDEGEEILGEDFFTGSGQYAGATFTWDLPETVRGNRIKIQQLGKNAAGNYYLHIMEVEAYHMTEYDHGPVVIGPEHCRTIPGEPNDLDNNSIPDDWQREKGLIPGENGLTEADCLEFADPDDDLISNHEEYLLGSNPLVPNGKPGHLTREVWWNIPGWSVDDSMRSAHVLGAPHERELLEGTQAPRNIGDAYHQRLRGTVTAPVSGHYTFWIASNQTSVFYLSTNERKYYKREIARVGYGAHDRGAYQTGFQEWNAYSKQRSAPIYLEEGREYFLDIHHKSDAHSSHISLAWQMPGGEREEIPAEYISSFGGDLADRDDDDLPDDWERQYGIDPEDNGAGNFDNGAWGDPYGTGITNREAFLRGWDPRAPSLPSPGEPVIDIPVSGGTPETGSWSPIGDGILSPMGRGSISYPLDLPEGGRYVLEIKGKPSGNVLEIETIDLSVDINDMNLGTRTLRSLRGAEGKTYFLLPDLAAGEGHRFTVHLKNTDLRRTFMITSIRILRPEGLSEDGCDLPEWLHQYLGNENALTSCTSESLISPLCVEGRSRVLALAGLEATSPQGAVSRPELKPAAGTGWYANIPLPEDGGEITLKTSFESGAHGVTTTSKWVCCDLLNYPRMDLRKGDSLRVTIGGEAQEEPFQINYTMGSRTWSSPSNVPVVVSFDTAGVHTLNARWTGLDGEPLQVSTVVSAYEVHLGGMIDLITGMGRNVTFPEMSEGIQLRSEPPLRALKAEGTPPAGTQKLYVSSDKGGAHYLVARVGEAGPVLGTQAFFAHDNSGTSTLSRVEIVTTYGDGSSLLCVYFSSESLPPGGYAQLAITAGGIQMLEGGTVKNLYAGDYSDEGLARVYMTSPAGTDTSICFVMRYYDASGKLMQTDITAE